MKIIYSLFFLFLLFDFATACHGGQFTACEYGFCNCHHCPQGSYCDGSSNIGVCADGLISFAGSSSINDCFPCPAGAFCAGGLAWACPQGTYSESVGASSESTCLFCAPGWINYDDTSVPCTYECGAGFYCFEGNYLPCPSHTYSTDNTAWNISSCLNCQSNFYSFEGSSYCSPCSDRGDIGDNQCSSCSVGHYCINGVSYACDSGMYNPSSISTSSSDCLRCAEGYTSSPGAAACVECGEGSYCSKGFSTKCPLNTFSTALTASSNSTCTPCDVGYISSIGSSSCVLNVSCALSPGFTGPNCDIICPAGYYCFDDDKKPCVGGTFNAKTGSSDVSSCLNCPIGTFSSSGQSSCLFCSDGYFSTSNTANACTHVCGSGHYCSHGLRAACPRGTWSANETLASISGCIHCVAGTASSQIGAVSIKACYNCGQGYTSFNSTNFSTCSDCGEGYYCTSSNERIPCPQNTFSLSLNAINVMSCVSCPNNQFSLPGSSSCGSIDLSKASNDSSSVTFLDVNIYIVIAVAFLIISVLIVTVVQKIKTRIIKSRRVSQFADLINNNPPLPSGSPTSSTQISMTNRNPISVRPNSNAIGIDDITEKQDNSDASPRPIALHFPSRPATLVFNQVPIVSPEMREIITSPKEKKKDFVF